MRRAFSSAEMVIAMLILGAGLVPMYHIFVKGRTSVTQSRISYMALHAARDELEELRQVPFNNLASMAHDWRKVEGPLFDRVVRSRVADFASNAVYKSTDLRYPTGDYQRISTRVVIADVSPADAGRMKKVVLDVRWEEKGAGTEVQREATSHFETIVSSGNLERF